MFLSRISWDGWGGANLWEYRFLRENQRKGEACETFPPCDFQKTESVCATFPLKEKVKKIKQIVRLPLLIENNKTGQIVGLSLFEREIRKLEQLRSLRAKNWQWIHQNLSAGDKTLKFKTCAKSIFSQQWQKSQHFLTRYYKKAPLTWLIKLSNIRAHFICTFCICLHFKWLVTIECPYL